MHTLMVAYNYTVSDSALQTSQIKTSTIKL